MPNTVTPSMPLNTAVPSALRISAPAPVPTRSGTTPRMNAKRVIRTGPSRCLAPCLAASPRATPAPPSCLAGRDHRGDREPGQVGRWIHLVAVDQRRTLKWRGVDQPSDRDHSPVRPTDLNTGQVIGRPPEHAVGLDGHLPVAVIERDVID